VFDRTWEERYKAAWATLVKPQPPAPKDWPQLPNAPGQGEALFKDHMEVLKSNQPGNSGTGVGYTVALFQLGFSPLVTPMLYGLGALALGALLLRPMRAAQKVAWAHPQNPRFLQCTFGQRLICMWPIMCALRERVQTQRSVM
jgi:hypothetical protein